MIKINKYAFTFIELLVVMTIIILLSGSGVVYFGKQVSSLKITNELAAIDSLIAELDTNIAQKKILDYILNFSLPQNTKGFSYTTNTLGVDIRQNTDFDSVGKTLLVSTNSTATGSQYNLDMYSGIKYKDSFLLDVTDTASYLLDEKQSYKFIPSFSGSIMNSSYIYYYSQDYISKGTEFGLTLTDINTQENRGGVSYSDIQIISQSGKKKILGNSSVILNQIYLFFEKDGIEKSLLIK